MPSVIATWVMPAMRSGAGMLAPATTGMTCSSAPSITCNMKPAAKRCVMASAPGVHRETRISPPKSSVSPATTPNSGAVRKKRSGAENGGVSS